MNALLYQLEERLGETGCELLGTLRRQLFHECLDADLFHEAGGQLFNNFVQQTISINLPQYALDHGVLK